MKLAALSVIVIVAALVLARFGMRFHDKQARGALGGRISRAKAYWLPFAIFFWFVACPAAAALSVLSAPVAYTLLGFGVFMWLRGAAEMVMLYVTKNWRPPYGITHDALCIVQLAVTPFALGLDVTALSGVDAWGVALVLLAIVSLVVEIHHAWSFFVAVGGKTMGDEGVWFADDDDERFRAINRNTFVWNVILTAALGIVLARLWMTAGGLA